MLFRHAACARTQTHELDRREARSKREDRQAKHPRGLALREYAGPAQLHRWPSPRHPGNPGARSYDSSPVLGLATQVSFIAGRPCQKEYIVLAILLNSSKVWHATRLCSKSQRTV